MGKGKAKGSPEEAFAYRICLRLLTYPVSVCINGSSELLPVTSYSLPAPAPVPVPVPASGFFFFWVRLVRRVLEGIVEGVKGRGVTRDQAGEQVKVPVM